MLLPLLKSRHCTALLAAELLALSLTIALVCGCEKETDEWVPIPVDTKRPSQQPTKPSVRPPVAPTTTAPTPPPPATGTAVTNDPLNRGDTSFMQGRARAIYAELIAALPAEQRGLVGSVPLVFTDRGGKVNAFAACVQGGALVGISDGLVQIQAQLARVKAADEIFGRSKVDAYAEATAKQGRAIPADGRFIEPSHDTDSRKVQRQHQLFDEELGWVLGHELAHHYLSHTGCIGPDARKLTPADLGRGLTIVVPALNQPAELAADTYGTHNLLTAGSRRQGYHLTEGGALLTLAFFAALRRASGANVLFDFESTHPHPAVRKPVVEQAASTWRATGGRPLPVLPLPEIKLR